MELRAARVALQSASTDAERAEQALMTAISEATTRRGQAEARLQALKEERTMLQRRLDELAPRLAQQKKEDQVLARGEVLRDEYVDWNPSNPLDRERNKDGYTVQEVKTIALMIAAAFLLLFGFLWAIRR